MKRSLEEEEKQVPVVCEPQLPFTQTVFKHRHVRHLLIFLKHVPADISRAVWSVSNGDTIEMMAPQATTDQEFTERLRRTLAEQLNVSDADNSAGLLCATYECVKAGPPFKITFRVGMLIDAPGVKVVRMSLPVGPDPANRCPAILIIAPELQESVIHRGTTDVL